MTYQFWRRFDGQSLSIFTVFFADFIDFILDGGFFGSGWVILADLAQHQWVKKTNELQQQTLVVCAVCGAKRYDFNKHYVCLGARQR